jgi:methyl-accepting chemotaxis protein
MVMLRAVVRQEIYDLLENTYFGSSNFDVTFKDFATQQIIFQVTFLGDLRFKFVVKKPYTYNKSVEFLTDEAPGLKFLTSEEYSCENFHQIYNRLKAWIERLREELIASNPLVNEVSTLRDQLEEHLADIGLMANDFFTKDEAAELEERLNAFSARLDEIAAKNDSLEYSVADLKRTVSDLQGAVELLNKGTWLRMAAGRVTSGIKKIAASKGIQDFALEAAKRLLLPGPKT